MRTKKMNNITKSESESEISHLLKPDHTTDTDMTTTPITPVEPDMELNITENVENVAINTIILEKKKRGRKKLIKPDTTNPLNECGGEQDDNNTNNTNNNTNTSNANANANCDNDGSNPDIDAGTGAGAGAGANTDKKEKKQRKVRISKKEKQQKTLQLVNDSCNLEEASSTLLSTTTTATTATTATIVHKKRGRKPRGGKIIHENQMQSNNNPEVPNIILHLKCVISDLKKSNEINSHKLDNYCSEKKMEILCYNDNDQTTSFSSDISSMSNYDNDSKNRTHYNKSVIKEDDQNLMSSNSNKKYDPSTFSIHPAPIPVTTETNASNAVSFSFSDKELNDSDCGLDCKNTNNKEIWKKISQLKLNFHRSDTMGIQRSSCFWDTCEFDTPPIHIPMSSTKGYGCFCHPECAVAYLMSENIDTSIKFERYYLLNSIYGPIYNYNKSIKPAANPHYLLNKFYGNLTINEYRKLFQCEQVIYMVNKPLTNVLPELYEDNNDFFTGNKVIQNSTIEIRKKIVKNAKSSIINEVFGIR